MARLVVKRVVGRVVLACIVALAALGATGSLPAGASGTDVCSLVTKKEVAAILGAKVVTLRRETNETTGALVCTYKTKKFTSKHLKKFNGGLGLEIIWGPVTQDLRDAIATSGSDLIEITGIGDAAYSMSGSVLALRGEDVVQASILNWQAPASKLSAKAEQAVRLAIPRLPTG